MTKFLKSHVLLILIISLAAFLRIYDLTSIPVGFSDDEATFGYNAYSILKTGHDEWARFLPFPAFESFGDWKLAFYLYLVVISEAFLGMTVFATRLPSVIFGIISVFAVYLLTKEIVNKKTAILATFLVAISPWHIAASRNGFESDLLIFTVTLATYFFIRGVKEKRFFLPSFVIFALSFYIYRSAWTFVPIFLFSLIFIFRKELQAQRIYIFKKIIVFLILLIPLVPVFITFKGQSRFIQESFITGIQNIGINNDINQRRGECQKSINSFICTAIYNKYNFFASKYINNLISNLSPQTYYQDIGSTGYQAFAPRGYFYTFEYILLIAGLIALLRTKGHIGKIYISWILTAAVAPSLTSVGNPGRLNIIMPVPQIISAIGFFYIYNQIKNIKLRYLLISILAFIVLASFFRFIADTLTYYPIYTARYQRYGYKELFTFLEGERSKHSQVAISRHSDDAKQYIHYLFFTKYDPAKYQKNVVFSKDSEGWRSVDQIENIKFYASTPSINDLPKDALIAMGGKEMTSDRLFEIFKIDDPKGDRIFNVYSIISPNE